MAIAKRIFLFLVVNVLIMITMSVVLALLGVKPYLTQYGLDYNSLMAFCLIWGFGGAFISLGLSRIMAKWITKARVIDPQTHHPDEQWLVQTVYRLAQAGGLSTMPQVAIYESPEVNAFATGPTKNRSLVAVSRGILTQMNRTQLEAVLGHEITHVTNGDMVTMTLIQGVINAFVMFIARTLAWTLSRFVHERSRTLVYFLCVIAFDILFSILGAMVVMYFSRQREFRADAGGARLAGRQNMIDALRALESRLDLVEPNQPALATMKISGGRPKGMRLLFASHPPLEERIHRLETLPAS